MDEARTYLEKAVALATRAAGNKAIVAGALGPYGEMLGDGSEYTGEYKATEADYIQYHKERLDILIEAGVNVFAFETIPNIEEIKAVKALLCDYPSIEAWVSVTLKDSDYLSDGTLIELVIRVVNEVDNILEFGVNCTSVKVIDLAFDKIITLRDKPLILYPNSGRKYDAVRKIWIDKQDESLVEAAVKWQAKAVKIIG